MVEMKSDIIIWLVPIKLSAHLLYDQAIMLLGVYSREMKIYVHKNACTWVFTAALFIKHQTGNNPNISVWTDNSSIVIYWNTTQQ